MVEDEGKKEDPFGFIREGERIGYISLGTTAAAFPGPGWSSTSRSSTKEKTTTR